MTLTKRRAVEHGPAYPPNWAVTESYTHGRTELTPGRELTIKGERGATFRFVRHVVVHPTDRRHREREWIDVIGGTAGVQMYRAFSPDKIGRVLPARDKKPARRR